MEWADWWSIRQAGQAAQEDETREGLIQAAFIGFQLGASQCKSFGEYLKKLGLQEDTGRKPSRLQAQAALADAQRIAAADKRERSRQDGTESV